MLHTVRIDIVVVYWRYIVPTWVEDRVEVALVHVSCIWSFAAATTRRQGQAATLPGLKGILRENKPARARERIENE